MKTRNSYSHYLISTGAPLSLPVEPLRIQLVFPVFAIWDYESFVSSSTISNKKVSAFWLIGCVEFLAELRFWFGDAGCFPYTNLKKVFNV